MAMGAITIQRAKKGVELQKETINI